MTLDPRWHVVEEKFDPKKMGHYESVFTLGNGYLGTRGVFEELYRERTPGTFVAGLFDQAHPNEVTELPNLPDWVEVSILLNGEELDLTQGQVLQYRRVLDLKGGVLTREVVWESPQGRRTALRFRRFVSLANVHLVGISIAVTPENYDGPIEFRSALNGQVTNSGTQHFTSIEHSTYAHRGIYLLQETVQSKQQVVVAANHVVHGVLLDESFKNAHRRIVYNAVLSGKRGQTVGIDKLTTIYTSRDQDLPRAVNLLHHALAASSRQTQQGFDQHLEVHQQVWEQRWQWADIEIVSDDHFDQLVVRFAVFHLIQMTPWNDPRVSVAAKGLSGEGYKGHVFWDTEIFILPFFLYSFPQVAKNLLTYRYLTLPGAITNAAQNGYSGAMFAWESADTGEETTPEVGGIDPVTRKPIPILCGKQEHHISVDIPYAIWNYYQVTGDRDFLLKEGAEILLLTARFWASRVSYNPDRDWYEIKEVIGPDEYKEGIDNNYYTNALVQWHLKKTAELVKLLKESPAGQCVLLKLGVTEGELQDWQVIAAKIRLPREGELLHQFEGFMELQEIDVLKYRDVPGLLQKAYGWEEINRSQVLKQADVVMLLYLLGDEFTLAEKRVNWDFYEPKTMHDSSLSAAIHSIVANDIDLAEEAYAYFQKAARIDLTNSMGNTHAGLHAASLGGCWQAVVHGFGGVRVKSGELSVTPKLPKAWHSLRFKLAFQGKRLQVSIRRDGYEVTTVD
ncbi:MAG: glycoside hydrolase family 65 protein [Firmicutes bacterium]|nr:glycoside hydrolase family 65 protein [Bacillota bacterium]